MFLLVACQMILIYYRRVWALREPGISHYLEDRFRNGFEIELIRSLARPRLVKFESEKTQYLDPRIRKRKKRNGVKEVK